MLDAPRDRLHAIRARTVFRGCPSASSWSTSHAYTGLDKKSAHDRMEYWTERLGLGWRREDNVQKLSLGNQRRDLARGSPGA